MNDGGNAMRLFTLSMALVLGGCGLNANDPYRDAPVVSLADAPPPIAGGTLLATRDARHAIIADADRHRVVLVDLATREVRVIDLDRDDEPGRIVEDGVGRVYVALRRGGAIAAIDPVAGAIAARHEACASPRGLAWESTRDELHVACADGTLVTLGADREIARTLALAPDLRDVLAIEGHLLVSRFRTAELLRVELDGSITPSVEQPPRAVLAGVSESGSITRLRQSYSPGVAVRLASAPGGAVLLHQRARVGPEAVFEGTPRPPGSYTYSNAAVTNEGGVTWRDPCGNAVVHAAASFVGPSGEALHGAPSIARGVVPVDVAVSSGGRVAIAFAGEPGGSYAYGPQVVRSSLAVASRDEPSGCLTSDDAERYPGQVVAVAFAGETELAQLREPARLVIEGEVIELGGQSVRDTGHDIFHLDTGGGVACASCHPGGGDDGHVWQFAAIGVVRTQPLEGMIGLTPYHRAGTVPSFSALMTSLSEQMAGPQLEEDALAAAEHWLRRLPAAPAGPALDLDAVARGREVFERSDVACASCHSGELGTDGASRLVGEQTWQTPPLRGVALRAPYLHDGSAPDLRAVISGAFAGEHGQTGHLSTAELDDLESYLRSR